MRGKTLAMSRHTPCCSCDFRTPDTGCIPLLRFRCSRSETALLCTRDTGYMPLLRFRCSRSDTALLCTRDMGCMSLRWTCCRTLCIAREGSLHTKGMWTLQSIPRTSLLRTVCMRRLH